MKYIKKNINFVFLGDNNVGIINFNPFNMYDIDLLRKGWRGFKIDSVAGACSEKLVT